MNSSQNKLILISVAILALLIFSFFMLNRNQQNPETATVTSQKEIAEEVAPIESDDINIKGSLLDLFNSGKSMQCSYSTSTDDMEINGTSYVSGKKMRADIFTTLSDGKTMETHMIADEGWAYTWTNESSTGFKINIAEVTKDVPELENPEQTSDEETIKDFQQDYDFDCKNWKDDNSKFAIPTNIEFTDFSKMMEGNGSACSACNYIEDADAKSQCLEALKCSN